ncbi:MAG: hypothetical protein E6J71_03960 [Deltaproteobacteria bacterium]|nr:MAG: hypothetical protein E6J71_03960 [Deltaproteobacteria bacterium]
MIRERQNDVAAAIECFERVVAANPRDASAHDHLGVNYKRQGPLGDARPPLLGRRPGNRDAARFRSRIGGGCARFSCPRDGGITAP